MFKSILQTCFLIFALSALSIMPRDVSGQQPKNPEEKSKWQPEGWPKWPDWDWLDSVQKQAEKKIEIVKGLDRPGPDIEFLHSRASDLLRQSSQARDNFFRCERKVNAANVLLDAAYGIYSSRKADRTPQDFWEVGRALQGLYFRVQQADFFISMSRDKYSDQYVTLARSLYQQARSASEAHEYQKAKYLADASWSIVTALESIAQASMPDSMTPGIAK